MSSVFVDTSAFLAVLDADSECHGRAKQAWERLLDEGRSLVTTSYVLVETTSLVQHRLGLEAVRVLLCDMGPAIGVIWAGPEEHRAAESAVLAAGRRKLSLVDCVSFEVMRRRGLSEALALDRHFRAEGFTVLP